MYVRWPVRGLVVRGSDFFFDVSAAKGCGVCTSREVGGHMHPKGSKKTR
jgi:hypothetical protein